MRPRNDSPKSYEMQRTASSIGSPGGICERSGAGCDGSRATLKSSRPDAMSRMRNERKSMPYTLAESGHM